MKTENGKREERTTEKGQRRRKNGKRKMEKGNRILWLGGSLGAPMAQGAHGPQGLWGDPEKSVA